MAQDAPDDAGAADVAAPIRDASAAGVDAGRDVATGPPQIEGVGGFRLGTGVAEVAAACTGSGGAFSDYVEDGAGRLLCNKAPEMPGMGATLTVAAGQVTVVELSRDINISVVDDAETEAIGDALDALEGLYRTFGQGLPSAKPPGTNAAMTAGVRSTAGASFVQYWEDDGGQLRWELKGAASKGAWTLRAKR